jgi:hypothetical protein
MRFTGVVPADAPDPRFEMNARLRSLPFPVFGLATQRTVRDTGDIGFQEQRDRSGVTASSVAISYLLLRNPDDPNDPGNVAVLDDATLAALAEAPPWPRPTWLLERAEKMRQAHLWEAVRTSWYRTPSEHSTVARCLTDHMNHILANSFTEELGIPLGTGWEPDTAWMVRDSVVKSGVPMAVSGQTVSAVEVDSDPFVYGVGAQLSSTLAVTIAVPRDDLRYLRIAIIERP